MPDRSFPGALYVDLEVKYLIVVCNFIDQFQKCIAQWVI